MKNKLDAYNKATENLVLMAADYELPIVGKHSFPEIVGALRESFKSPATYNRVFGYDKNDADMICPSTGYCLISSYYIYLKTGGEAQWIIKKQPLHWWLEHKVISGPFDITYDQFPSGVKYYPSFPENLFNIDPKFAEKRYAQAMMLGQAAGLE